MAGHSVLVYARDEGFADALRAQKLPDLSISEATLESEARGAIPEADILLANPDLIAPHLSEAVKLKWVQTVTVGVDALLSKKLRRDYILTNARGILGPKLAEYAFAHILAYKKIVLELHDLQKKIIWDSRSTASLVGETITVLGTGSIGTHIAMAAKTFGMRTVGFRTQKEPVEFFDLIFGADELSKALALGDYVVSVMPATSRTNDIISSNTIRHMKDGVVFINIGRGNAVEENDLLVAVRSGKIKRAILDVFKKEPLPSENPLWTEENVVITPHMAGYADPDAVVRLFAENYRRFLSGEKLRYLVDFDKGY